MHRTSESIATIATALAKAQLEMRNPEKSTIGSIHRNTESLQPQYFRYAPLSRGLDILRKVLGVQQIAIVQTTTINQDSKGINLTTTLMHTSGEWISSEWPVCHLDDMVSPRRMGAALTYARRYALFTLVGIAGEDDLDTPLFHTSATLPETPARTTILPSDCTYQNPDIEKFRSSRGPVKSEKKTLDLSSVANIREQAENLIEAAEVLDDLYARAAQILGLKNQLSVDAAKVIETLFVAQVERLKIRGNNVQQIGSAEDLRLTQKPIALQPQLDKQKLEKSAFRCENKNIQPVTGKTRNVHTRLKRDSFKPKINTCGSTASQKIDKSELTFGEPRRLRDKDHLKFVASQPCLVCGRTLSDAHHLRFTQPRALSRKVSDEFTVPLCRTHHRENHRQGNELLWWDQQKIDPMQTAARLWQMKR